MRARRVTAVLLCGTAVGSFALTSPASSQGTEPRAFVEAPAAFVDDLLHLYRSLDETVQGAIALGAPAELAADAVTTDEFAGLLGTLDGDALASLYHVGGGTRWARVETTADALVTAADAMEAAVRATPGVERAARTVAPLAPATLLAPSAASLFPSAGDTDPYRVPRFVPTIPPPPQPFEPSVPVAATEPLTCPEIPPGPDVGNLSIYLAKVLTSAVVAVVEFIPPEIEFNLEMVAQSFPNPARIVGEVIREIANVTELTLTYIRDIYWDCGGVNVFGFAETTENSVIQIYGLVDQANRTLNTITDGLITVSDQVQFLHESTDHIRTLRINQALAAPIGTVPNVAFVLPATEGGYLDTDPIGVRAIVHQTLAAAQAAGIPVNFAAVIWRVQADLAVTAGDELLAYQMYQRSYQAIGR